MLKRRRLLSLALSALIGFIAGEARAGTISMTIDVGGGPFSVDPFVIAPGPGLNDYGTVDLTTLNATLAALGSAYVFDSLGGSSNFSGTFAQGFLKVNGGIKIVAGKTGSTFLKLTEFQTGFLLPTGPMGVLKSSSTGNFLNQVAGAGHTASSAFNATSTPTYSVLATTAGGAPGADPETGGASVPIAPVSTLYTLTNVITFGLTPSPASTVSDGFSVQGTLSVPEPASLVVMLTALPLPLVFMGLILRRRAMGKV